MSQTTPRANSALPAMEMGAGCRFVFSDGHGLASFTNWYEDLEQLDQVDGTS
jgi:hypothetical protein